VTPFYDEEGITLYAEDCRQGIGRLDAAADCCLADPPYGDTTLEWDRWPAGWVDAAAARMAPSASLWCFGSFRMFRDYGKEFTGWSLAQDLIWEKHNGSGLHADRFKRVHEHAVQFYRGKWADVFKSPVYTHDATKRTIRRKEKPQHMGAIAGATYASSDGGPRLMRSVLQVRSCHGHAIHPTQKPEALVTPLLRYSLKPGGLLLVPFAGSGVDLLVARQLGCRAIGFEVNTDYCQKIVDRLAQRDMFVGAQP
jgi:site-specific DNA-methyltransferase (adenine-specific)